MSICQGNGVGVPTYLGIGDERSILPPTDDVWDPHSLPYKHVGLLDDLIAHTSQLGHCQAHYAVMLRDPPLLDSEQTRRM